MQKRIRTKMIEFMKSEKSEFSGTFSMTSFNM